MKIGVVVDPSCDLPSSFFKNGDVELLPTTIKIGDHSFVDHRDDAQTIKFHSDTKTRMKQKIETSVESRPLTSEQIEALFLEKLVHKFDHVFCIMATHARSDIYDDVMKASRSILVKHRQVRREAGLDVRFTLTVINSGNIFTGTAVLTAEVVRMIKAGATPSAIESRINELVPHTYRSSKAAANMVVKSMAVDLKEKGITSVAFNPGWVKTDMGGPNAMIPVEQSVTDMRKVIDGLIPADTGKFIGNDGRVISW